MLNIPKYIYKRARRLRKSDSPLFNLFFKIFSFVKYPKCIYKRARRLRKFESSLLNLFLNFFSFPKYSQVHLQKELKGWKHLISPYSICSSRKFPFPNIPKYICQRARRLKTIWFPLLQSFFQFFFPFPSTSIKELEGE